MIITTKKKQANERQTKKWTSIPRQPIEISDSLDKSYVKNRIIVVGKVKYSHFFRCYVQFVVFNPWKMWCHIHYNHFHPISNEWIYFNRHSWVSFSIFVIRIQQLKALKMWMIRSKKSTHFSDMILSTHIYWGSPQWVKLRYEIVV